MQLIFNYPHLFHPGSDPAENSYALNAELEKLIGVNMTYLRLRKMNGYSVPPLYDSGVVYGRTLWWEPIPALYERRSGDCKSLTSALVAEYRLNGIRCRPVFRFVPKPDGSTDYHILVQTMRGFEDPSKILGMTEENAPFFALR